MWLFIVFSAVVLGVPVGYFILRDLSAAREKQREIDEEQAAAAENALVRSAPPLVPVTERPAVFARIAALMEDFDRLATFADADRWDREAEAAIRDAAAADDALARAIQEAGEAVRAAGDGDGYRVKRTERLRDELAAWRSELAGLADELEERIDLTPNNQKTQREALRELRAVKKDLALQKREARADAAAIRRDARVAAAALAPSAFAFRHERRVAAEERRRLRRDKEAALLPHEDAVRALDRQIVATERRIEWVRRFGDDED